MATASYRRTLQWGRVTSQFFPAPWCTYPAGSQLKGVKSWSQIKKKCKFARGFKAERCETKLRIFAATVEKAIFVKVTKRGYDVYKEYVASNFKAQTLYPSAKLHNINTKQPTCSGIFKKVIYSRSFQFCVYDKVKREELHTAAQYHHASVSLSVCLSLNF